MLSVTVYSTGSSCQRCRLTIRKLEETGIRFTVIDVTDANNLAAREFITEDLGYREAPVVIVDDEPQHYWSGFRPDLIDRLASAGMTRSPASGPAPTFVAGIGR